MGKIRNIDTELLLLIYLGILFCIISLASCSILKSKKVTTTESGQVVKRDSGSVRKDSGSVKKESGFTREIYYYGKDTTINNYYSRPAIVIKETGTSKSEETKQTTSANWDKGQDSTIIKHSETTKEKEEKAFSFWQIAALAIGVIVLMKLIPDFKIKLG